MVREVMAMPRRMGTGGSTRDDMCDGGRRRRQGEISRGGGFGKFAIVTWAIMYMLPLNC